MPHRIAIVISTYNAPEMLQRVLQGYARQNDPNFTIYIADDGSAPETGEIIDNFRKQTALPVVHTWHEDNGFRKARIHNRVIQALQEDYVLLTDGDCIPLPGLIAAHRKIARHGHFVSGSRILLSKQWSRHLQTGQHNDIPMTIAKFFTWRCTGRINRLLPLLLPVHASAPHDELKGIRGCHFAFWRNDLLTVNGFDESFEGWGREDSDLAARMLHAGIRRIDLRGSPVLHLWHQEVPRHRLPENDVILHKCLDSKRIRALKGLDELSPQ